jgi:hypothetical protein
VFGFQFVAKNNEGWLKKDLYIIIWYIARFGQIFLWDDDCHLGYKEKIPYKTIHEHGPILEIL